MGRGTDDLHQALVRRPRRAAVERVPHGLVGDARARARTPRPRQATTPGTRRHPLEELVEEARAADARRPGEHHSPQPSLGDATHGLGQLGELALPAHERHGPKHRRPVQHTSGVSVDPTPPRTAVHPSNLLNDLSGEEWLYFTKSLLTTAYPSELGHAARKAHGANKPPRLMARLIEYFTKPGELVLDPFAGVGGTLLGAAICRAPRRALGIELEPRWAEVYAAVVAAASDGDAGQGRPLRGPRRERSGRPAPLRPIWLPAPAWGMRRGCWTTWATPASTWWPPIRPTTRSCASPCPAARWRSASPIGAPTTR